MSGAPMPVLGIDTCGPAGSVALAKVGQNGGSILGQVALEGRTYSATVVEAVRRLLHQEGLALSQLGCIVVVNGPGSFTGVRVGLSAAKGLAFGAGVPVVAVSRLEVLARKSGCPSAALDAHRHELFLRLAQPEGPSVEILAGRDDFLRYPAPERVAVCDDPAAAILAEVWPSADLVRVEAPTAADAIRVASSRIGAGDFDDIVLLDGHYLRRSDAEIFGEKGRPAETGGSFGR
ncbi:MAG TPA: tRNA (adenosine(37)-N6)-threonylcarbamoyltransferase complex dimerization subunit type 1 TsaB [Terracidiphilus sp.]|nr:tRNA (adenosine(37)-N6)-threonylcarbamoyltransferase complex dimerization subunit type 1 TsaB [Terracidiphilus sp.]